MFRMASKISKFVCNDCLCNSNKLMDNWSGHHQAENITFCLPTFYFTILSVQRRRRCVPPAGHAYLKQYISKCLCTNCAVLLWKATLCPIKFEKAIWKQVEEQPLAFWQRRSKVVFVRACVCVIVPVHLSCRAIFFLVSKD